MLKWIVIVVVGLAALVGGIALIGLFVPRDHSATVRARFRAKPEALYDVLVDVQSFATWRPEVRAVTLLDPIGGKPAFAEDSKHGKVRYVVEQTERPALHELRIADEDLPYGGTWTFRLTPDGDGTVVTVTEDGEIKSPVFRALARFVFGYHATMEGYLSALGTKFGESVKPERIP